MIESEFWKIIWKFKLNLKIEMKIVLDVVARHYQSTLIPFLKENYL